MSLSAAKVQAGVTALAMGGGSVSATAAILLGQKYGLDANSVAMLGGLFAGIGHGLVNLVHKIGSKK